VPTGLSSTSTATVATYRPHPVVAAQRAVADVGHLVRFRAGTVRRKAAVPWTLAIMLGLTVAACTLPMTFPGARTSDRARDVLLLLPTAFAAFLLLTVISAVASGGGRELLSREQGVAYPVSPTTDHLGALLLAPLNIAWLMQAWVLLGSVAYGLPVRIVPAAVISVILWLAASTAIAQIVAWSMEAIRRQHHGIGMVRAISVALGLSGLALQLSGRLGEILDQIPTVWFVAGATIGFEWRWLYGVGVELTVFVLAVIVGAVPAHLAARRMPRDEARMESGQYVARRLSSSVFGMLVRTDRSSVWRSVPMRRGIAVLAFGPGVVAIAGNLDWPMMTILPGLVASGGALLFGVNAWCLDGRGLLWRENLPARPGQVFGARCYVLAEFLLVASLATILLASLRAGIPTSYEFSALVCLLLVVTIQVVGAALRWSAQRPFPVDMRSARATPAPPIVMVGYSTRLAVSTTMTGLVFSGLARVPDWRVSVLVAAPFLIWSAWRLNRTANLWLDPVERARVVMTTAA
jgi:hypothetical protein